MPTRLGKTESSEADQTLAKALSHPIRAEALTILNARVASPTEIAKELDVPLGNVNYHIEQLVKFGCAELVRTRPRRGATEHFYRGVAQKYMSDAFWGKLSHPVRNSVTWQAVRVLFGAVRDSLASGLFDRRKDRHISIVTYELDGQGWAEAKKLYKETLEETMEIGARAASRIARGERMEGKGLRASFGMVAFESPEGSPSDHELLPVRPSQE